jgi:hypothetical protein
VAQTAFETNSMDAKKPPYVYPASHPDFVSPATISRIDREAHETVVAVGALSSLTVKVTQDFDINLIGFLRDRRFNVYYGVNRITHPHNPEANS